jgi:hypothetical protein
MKLESQVTSLELSKQLKSLGVKQDSAFYWYCPSGDLTRVSLIQKENFTYSECTFSAFTCTELREMLPPETIRELRQAETEADFRAKMLIYLINQGIIKIE